MPKCGYVERQADHRRIAGNNAVHRLPLNYIHLLTLVWLLFSTSTLFAAASESLSSGDNYRHGDPLVEDQLTVETSRVFLRRLFDKYGDASTAPTGGDDVIDDRSSSSPSSDMMMTFEGFEHLLESLGLGDIRIADHIIDDHRQSTAAAAAAATSAARAGQFRRLHEHDETGWHRHQRRQTDEDDDGLDRQKRSGRADDGDDGSSPKTDIKHETSTPASEPAPDVVEKIAASSSTPSRRSSFGDRLQRPSRHRKSRTAEEAPSSMVPSERTIVLQKCMSAMEILQTYHIHHYTRHVESIHPGDDDDDDGRNLHPHSRSQRSVFDGLVDIPDYISQTDFIAICPSIIYQLDERICQPTNRGAGRSSRPSMICGDDLNVVDGGSGRQNCTRTAPTTSNDDVTLVFGVPLKIWGFAVLSIVVISLVGLLSVAIIPFMGSGDRRYFNGLLQLLIAVAVGTLTGDAVLHLLPHAMAPHDSHAIRPEQGNHRDHPDDGNSLVEEDKTVAMVTHGLAVLVGIFGFLIVERLLSIGSRFRNRRTVRSKSQNAQAQQVGHKLSACKDEQSSTVGGNTSIGNTVGNTDRHRTKSDVCAAHIENSQELVQLLNVAHANEDASNTVAVTTTDLSHNDRFELTTDDVDRQLSRQPRQGIDEIQIAVSTDKGHSRAHHGHGHSHGAGESSGVASVAWMIIMGDGLHNFTDGLAIGASFVGGGMAGGLGTTVAVFCHELPHELGDFAVLLNAGMSVRQALFYNLVSSVLSFVGMLIGVIIGNIGSASSWIFGLTAGIFIYISLVDMMPQMTAPEDDDDSEDQRPLTTDFIYLLLHVLGIAGGLTIMTFIALFEERIQMIAGIF